MTNTRRLVLMTAICIPTATFAAEYLNEVESEVYEVTGTQAQIAQRGRACMAQLLANEETELYGDSHWKYGSKSTNVEGGDVLQDAIPEEGVVVATSRYDMPGSGMSGRQSIRSRITFLAREGRFKIRHTNIEMAAYSSGTLPNIGYHKVGKWWGAHSDKVEASLKTKSYEIATCVRDDAAQDDW